MNDMSKTREQGFYRVKHKDTHTQAGPWDICWWSADAYTQWMFIGQEHTTFSDDQFAEIDEHRINCTPEPKTETVQLADGVHAEVDPNIKTRTFGLSDGSTIDVEV